MKTFAAFLAALVMLVGYGIAQTTNASLAGTVTDASGAVVPGASVSATGIDTGVVNKTITNDSGAYQFASLQPGKYRVVAEMAGFQKVTFDPVELNVSANVRLNFKLPVAGASHYGGSERGGGIAAADRHFSRRQCDPGTTDPGPAPH